MRRELPIKIALTAVAVIVFAAEGCAPSGIKATDTHRKGLEALADEEYFAPKKPVDRHYIGYAWSRQFGPVEDAGAPDLRVKKERSLSNVQQGIAYNRGIALGGQATQGETGEFGALIGAQGGALIGAQSGRAAQTKLSGVEVISAVSLADIPFQPDVPYVTEALRLANFRIKDEKSRGAGIGFSAGTRAGSAVISAESGGQAMAATEGEGLVVAYKLHRIDMTTYQKRDSGDTPLGLEKSIEFPGSGLFVKAKLLVIEPGAGRSMPRNLLWSCPRAEAMSRDMVAAWLVDIKSTDPKRKSLTVAFPAYPKVDECQHYAGTIQSRIDPLTDKINRQRIQVAIVEAELSDSMTPKVWDARVSLVEESFNIQLVKPSDLEKRSMER